MTEKKPSLTALPGPGRIEISQNAIASIAAYAAARSYGIVGMAAKNVVEGIAATVTGDPHKGIDVHLNGDAIKIDLYVIVEYGTRISSVAHSVANTVKFNVEKATSLTVAEVNVYVQGLRVSNTD
ncbi:MAG TPA: Asp23/Gls24 family envelope stress response protein [Anaerolineales bacterium]|nr:Asp23/Gls24 family envelope stress response protein [Anaerolineales bacterium]